MWRHLPASAMLLIVINGTAAPMDDKHISVDRLRVQQHMPDAANAVKYTCLNIKLPL